MFPENPLIRLERHANSTDYVLRQVGYCARWCLDNYCKSRLLHMRRRIECLSAWHLHFSHFIFRFSAVIIEGRTYSYEVVDVSNVNVMLNTRDVSEYLKISPDGLEARCDAYLFESVRCTYQVNSGCWYYEVLIITPGVMQIGWATKDSNFLSHVSLLLKRMSHTNKLNVNFSISSILNCAGRIWHRWRSILDSVRRMSTSDLAQRKIAHTRSIFMAGWFDTGLPIGFGCAWSDFQFGWRRRRCTKTSLWQCKVSSTQAKSQKFELIYQIPCRDGFFAAASCMSFQQCRFNFGSEPFKFPPKSRTFDSFNSHAYLKEQDKIVLPRHLFLEQLRKLSVREDSCTLCFDLKGIVRLEPCMHR